MSKARLAVTAVVLEGRDPTEVAATYGLSRSWLYELLARHRTDGDAGLEPRSRRPATSPRALPPSTVSLIVNLRQQLLADGHDAGADTLVWHLREHHQLTVSRSTVWRVLRREGLIVPEPKKRPKASLIRFTAELPNSMWQTDFTHVALADGTDVEVLTFLDDHSRYALSITAHTPVTGPAVVTTWRATTCQHGIPASVLSDNGMVFTTRFAGGRGGRNAFEHDLARLGVTQKNSRPAHPQTCGKVERFQQTLKNWLARQPPADSTQQLQTQLDTFTEHYNTRRPHRALHGRTPAAAYTALPKATPTEPDGSHERIRHDKIDNNGKLTLRHAGRLHHIGIGRAHAGSPILMLIQDLDVRVVHAHTGELLRQLTLDTNRDYQPRGTRKSRTP